MGAARGLGQAFAQRFAQEGAELILTDVDGSGLEKAAAAFREQGIACTNQRLDLAVETEIIQFATKINARHPRLDVLVNNSGIAYGEVAHASESPSQEQWLRFLAMNTVAPLLLAQALRPSLAAARGVVLNITSMAGYAPGTAYGVAKAALNAMTYGMANAFAADGIRVNAIAPGPMEAPASRSQLPPWVYERVQRQQLLKLHGTADDITALALFLASDEGRFINCEIVACNADSRIRGLVGQQVH
jgi:NAD(P)-dependent dehydrogenase (short-subunit alcohol dehydrogenase family)